MDQQALDVGGDHRVVLHELERRGRAREDAQRIQPRPQRRRAEIDGRLQLQRLAAGMRLHHLAVDAQHELLAVARQVRDERSAGLADDAVVRVRIEHRVAGLRQRMAAQAEHQQVVVVQAIDVHAHRRAEGDGADADAADACEVHVRAHLPRVSARQQQMRLHDPRDALARIVEVARLEQAMAAQCRGLEGLRGHDAF